METFDYHGDELNVFHHLYNSTSISERGVEIAAANHFLAWTEGTLLEVGNVLSHYGIDTPRTIVDKYEQAPGVDNIDVFDVYERYDRIVAISTLEHVGFDFGEDYDTGAAARAIEHLHFQLKPSGKLLVTFGMGLHPTLDPETLHADRSAYYVRGSEKGHWASKWSLMERTDIPPAKLVYGHETPWATTVWVGEFYARDQVV